MTKDKKVLTNQMIVITYDKKRLYGGLGDRIIGLIWTKIISKILNKKFKIKWTINNINDWINYDNYDYSKVVLDNSKKGVKKYYFDKYKKYKNEFKFQDISDIFNNDITFISSNINILKLCLEGVNKKYLLDNYYDLIYQEYQNLYTNIFIPTDKTLKIIDNLLLNATDPSFGATPQAQPLEKSNIIGIQIRAGDAWMVAHRYKKIKNDNEIHKILNNIKVYIELSLNIKNYKIFLTSDYSRIKEIGTEIFDKKLIYYDEQISHLDKGNRNNNIILSKIFIDNIFLSQKTDILFISSYSGYGIIAALSAKHQNIYNLNLDKLSIKSLIDRK